MKCKNCNGTGTSGVTEPPSEKPVSDIKNPFNALGYLITWCVLFYLTYEAYVPLIEMIFGKDVHVSELVQWLNVVVMLVPPTVIVYLFRKFIPRLFAISICIVVPWFAYGIL